MDFIDFSGNSDAEVFDTINNWIRTPFELYDCNLYEFKRIRMNDGCVGGFLKLHHIIGAAWTISLICNQLINVYEGLISKQEMKAHNPSYIGFIESEKSIF